MNKICVYAICKNEIDNIDRWLDSMSEADYIVVLDTGSTDGTFEKLKADKRVHRIEVKHYKNFRFDVARNDSMELIPEDADILVCTDLDEIFDKGWASILRKEWKENTTRCFYKYVWSHNSLGEEENVFAYDKIHTRDYKWIYPVHEVLEAIQSDFKEESIDLFNKITLHHYQKTKDRKFYFDLLKLAVNENKDDCHIRMLLAREYLLLKDYNSAINEYLETLKLPEINEPSRRLVLLCSLFCIANCYFEIGNYDEALWYSQEFIKEDSSYREPYLIMAECYNDMHMFTLAEGCIECARKYGIQHNDWLENAYTYHGWLEDVASVTEFNLHNIDEAIKNIKIALSHNPDDVRLLRNLNGFYEQKIDDLKNNKKKGKQVLYE